MNLQDLKNKTPADLILEAEKLGIENPSTMRKQEILFGILKKLAEKNEKITGSGVLETLQDGFGHRDDEDHNAIKNAKMPHWNRLWDKYAVFLLFLALFIVGGIGQYGQGAGKGGSGLLGRRIFHRISYFEGEVKRTLRDRLKKVLGQVESTEDSGLRILKLD